MRLTACVGVLFAAATFGGAPLRAQDAPADHPVRLDRTGIRWEIPFEAARTRAANEQRLLVIKPVAFGTTPEGCW
jgi:hypothetical protein